MHQHRIDQQQTGGRQGQDPRPGHLPAPERGPGGHPGHGRGPQYRGLEPGEEGEEAEHGEHGDEAGGEAEAAEGDPGHHEHERHVLARHRQQVAQARRPEVVGRGRRLAPVVAEQDTGEQRRWLGPERGGAPDDRPAEAVGHPADGVADLDRTDLVDQQPSGHVADGQVGAPRDGDHPARDRHPLPRQGLGQGRRGHLVGHLDLQATSVEADDGREGSVVDLGIRHEHDGPVGDPLRPGRLEAGPCTMPEAGGEQEPTEAEQSGPPPEQGDRHQADADDERDRRRPPRPEGHEEGEDDRGPVAHC